MPRNLHQNSIQPRPNHFILKPQNHNAKLRQISRAGRVMRFANNIEVARSIQFNRYFFGGTIEIQHVFSHTVLPTKFAVF